MLVKCDRCVEGFIKSYAHHHAGACFKCNGTGKLEESKLNERFVTDAYRHTEEPKEKDYWVLTDGDEGVDCWYNPVTGETHYVKEEFPEEYFYDQ